MYALQIKPELEKILNRLYQKDKRQFLIIHKKVEEIRSNYSHKYKPLSKGLHGFYRVHIDSSFVLLFKIDNTKKVITLYYYDHHDRIYDWRPKY